MQRNTKRVKLIYANIISQLLVYPNPVTYRVTVTNELRFIRLFSRLFLDFTLALIQKQTESFSIDFVKMWLMF